MKEVDVLKDILHYRMSSQIFYNENIINLRNPSLRNLFTLLRDDETRAIVDLQQKIHRLEINPNIISKILPSGRR